MQVCRLEPLPQQRVCALTRGVQGQRQAAVHISTEGREEAGWGEPGGSGARRAPARRGPTA